MSASSKGIPKWLLGLSILVPLAAGLAYVLLGEVDGGSASGPKKKKSPGKSPKASPIQEAKAKKSQKEAPVDIDTIKDPLKRAIAHKDKGNEYFFQGRYELAIGSYSEAIATCPQGNSKDLSIFHQNRAAAYEQLDKLDNVLQDCDTALSLSFKYVKALDRRSKVARRLSDKPDASPQTRISLLSQALEDLTTLNLLTSNSNPENIMSLESIAKTLARLEASLSPHKSQKPSKLSVKAFFTYFARDPCLSMGKNKALNGNVTNGGHVLKGFEGALEAFENEDYDSIVPFCDEELENPDSPHRIQAKLLRATIFAIMKNVDKSFQDLSDLLEDPGLDKDTRVNVLIKRSYAYIHRLQDPQLDADLCFGEYRKAKEVDPENPDIYLHRGQHYMLMDFFDEAIADFTTASQLVPDSSIPQAQKYAAQYRKSSKEGDRMGVRDSIEGFEGLVTRFPNCVECHSLYAQILSEIQEYDKSISMFKKAQSISPSDATLIVQEALILLGGKTDIQGAKERMLKALEVDPLCEFAYENLACLETRLGNRKRATELFDKAIELVPLQIEREHLFALKNVSLTQEKVMKRLGILPPTL